MQDGRGKQSGEDAVQRQTEAGVSTVFTAHFHRPRSAHRMRSRPHRQALRDRAAYMPHLQHLEPADGTEQTHYNHYSRRQRRNPSHRSGNLHGNRRSDRLGSQRHDDLGRRTHQLRDNRNRHQPDYAAGQLRDENRQQLLPYHLQLQIQRYP